MQRKVKIRIGGVGHIKTRIGGVGHVKARAVGHVKARTGGVGHINARTGGEARIGVVGDVKSRIEGCRTHQGKDRGESDTSRQGSWGIGHVKARTEKSSDTLKKASKRAPKQAKIKLGPIED